MLDFLHNLPYKTYIGLFLCSLFASHWLIPRIIWLSRGLGLFYRTKTNHQDPPPSLGGLAIGIPLIAGISLLMLLRNQVSENMYMVPLQMRGLFVGLCLSAFLGLVADIFNLNRYLRLSFQIAIAAVAYHYTFRLGIHLPLLPPYVFTMLVFVVIISFFNLLKRLFHKYFFSFNLLFAFSLLIFAFVLDQYRMIVVCSLIAGSLVSFLSYTPPTRPDLGNVGIFVLGFSISSTLLQSNIITDSNNAAIFAAGLLSLITLFFLLESNLANRNLKTSLSHRQYDRSLNYIKLGLSLKIKLTASPDECWEILCRAAREFDYSQLTHISSSGKIINTWSENTNRNNSFTYSLRHSGGTLKIAATSTKEENSNRGYFIELVQLFDQQLEQFAISSLDCQTNDLRILLVNRYFSGMSATGQILADLAKDLHSSGAHVTVLTSANSYDSLIDIAGRNEICDGIHICRVSATRFGRSNHLNRTMDFAFFYLFSIAWILQSPSQRYTHIITFSDPPLIAFVGFLAQKMKRWKFIYNIQDLYPETALALNLLQQGTFYKLCDRFNKMLLSHADAVVVIGNKMAAYLQDKKIPLKHLAVIPNWADANIIKPQYKKKENLLQELGLKDVYTVIYAGNMGLAQEIDVLIELLKRFKDNSQIQFLFVGGGVRRIDLANTVSDLQIDNVRLVNYQPRDDLADYLALGDIGIVTLSSNLEGLAVPTRTYSYLAAGLPLLAISHANSDLKVLASQGLGFHFEPKDCDGIERFLLSQIARGDRAPWPQIRIFFETHADRPLQTKKYLDLLYKLLQPPT